MARRGSWSSAMTRVRRLGRDARACVLLPGHWIEPSRAGRRHHEPDPDLAQGAEEAAEDEFIHHSHQPLVILRDIAECRVLTMPYARVMWTAIALLGLLGALVVLVR